MGKTLTLKLAGLWTSPNDYTTKDGALDEALNCVIDQTDLGESRRGFEVEIDNSEEDLDGYLLKSFTATDPEASDYDLLTFRYNTSVPEGLLLLNDQADITGDVNFLPPSPSMVARMLNWGKYVYVAAATGIKRVSPVLETSVAAGIPQALDVVLSLTGSSGYLAPNTIATITATRTNASATLTTISNDDIANALIGQVLSGTGIPDGATILSISLSAPVVIHSATLVAGSTTITVASNLSIAANQIVTGDGIPENTRVVSISGAGPYSVVLTNAALRSATADATFNSDNTITMSAAATSGAATVTSVTLSDGTQVAYRMIWGLVNENKATMVGAPSGFVAITNSTGGSRDVVVNATIPEGITTDNFYQIYRSPATPTADIVPPDQMQLVAEGVPSGTDISNGYIQVTDQTPDSLKGESLYTGTDVDGITQANYQPPIAVDICVFRDHALFLNFTLEHQLKLNMDGIGGSDGIDVGDEITITDGVDPFVLTGAATEDIAAGEFAVITTGTPAQNIADTCASFIRVLNRFTDNTIVYAYLLSGPNELPGQMLIQARATKGEFSVVASANGTAWTPNIDSAVESEAENQKNGILIAKSQQVEAVPRVNLRRAGGIGSEILRAIPLRDYVIILTTSGVYRMTGQTITDFVVEPFDLTVVCVAPETAVALGNECWALTTQGVVSISDGGVRMRSALQINADLLALIRNAPTSVKNVAFAVGYETDQRYILALPGEEGDTTCSQQLCYNYITDRWTNWDRGCTAGYVNTTKGLYLGNSANTNIVKERKNGDYSDYADESFEVEIVSFDGTDVVLTSVAGITEGDILWQDQAAGIVFSEILEIDVPSNSVVVANEVDWDLALDPEDTRIYTAIENIVQWKPNAAGDPTEAKQFGEGQIVFKSIRFAQAILQFATDISTGLESVELEGLAGALGWGQFPWGNSPWGGTVRPQTLRFYIPANKQYGGSITVRMTIRSAYSNWKSEGISIVFNSIGYELGGPSRE